ncbi:DUF4347 domain-containing protein [Sphingomonas sp. MMS24-JH45]
MMFDAAAVVAAQDTLAISQSLRPMSVAPIAGMTATRWPASSRSSRTRMRRRFGPVEPSPREIVFIDTSVADYRQLAAEWADRGEVVLIDGTADGLDQMRHALVGRSDLGAIHLVGHGDAGVLWLGTTRIDTAAIGGDLPPRSARWAARCRRGATS